MMQSSWTLKENSTGELIVTVDGDAWKKAQKKALTQLRIRCHSKDSVKVRFLML